MADISKINPNGTEYNLKDATARANTQSSKTLKSSVVTVPDAAPINAEDITVDITPKQDLHGYDRPWAGGAGKNKFNPNFVASSVTVNVDSKGYLNITIPSSAATGNVIYLYSSDLKTTLSANTTYTLSCIGSSNGVQVSIRNSARTVVFANVESDTAVQYTPTENTEVYFVVRIQTNTAQTVVLKPQLEKGSSATTFAPYSNICPLAGWTGAELDRVGKNWLPNNYSSSSAAGISYTVNNDGTVIASNTATNISSFGFGGIKRIKAGSYILNGCPIGGSSSTFELQIVINGTTYRDYGSGVAFSTDHDADYSIQILIRNGYACPIGGLLFKAMIRLASITDSTYEPYQGQQYTASFGETVHGGKWHVTAGGTDKTTNDVDLGSLDWTYSPSFQRFESSQISDMKQTTTYVDNLVMCTCFKIDNAPISGADKDGTIASYTNSRLYVKYSAYTDATEFKTAVIGQKLVYEKAAPTTISTPKQNVPMLKGINTVSADCGDTSLKYQPDNVIGELKGEIEDNIIYEDFKWTTDSSKSYSAGTPGTYGTSSWRDVKKEGYDVIGVTFVENRRFGDCILTLYYIPSTSHVEVIIFRATSSAVTIADEDIEYRVAYKKRA